MKTITDARLRHALDRLSTRPTAVTVADTSLPDAPLVYANPAFTALTGYDGDAVIGRNCRFLQGDGTDPVTIARIRRTVAERTEGAYCLVNYDASGAAFHNLLMLAPLPAAQGGDYILGCQYLLRSNMLAREIDGHVANIQGVIGRLNAEEELMTDVFWESLRARTEAIRLAVEGYLLSVDVHHG